MGITTRRQVTGVWSDDVYNVKDHGAIGGGGADDTAAIQAAITAAEAVNGTAVVPDGTYGLIGTLKISSSVHIILSQGAEIKQLSGGNTLLETMAVDATPSTVTSITASGNVATITDTAHGYSAGNYILIHSSDSDGYNGVFEVQTVPTADTLTVRLPYAPVDTTADGTIIMLPAVGKVTLEGGAWNYDNATNNSSGGTNANLVIMYGVHTLTIRDVKFIEAEKYACYVAGVQNFVSDNVVFDTDSDGYHCTGPIYSADIRRSYGRTLDNFIAVSMSDGTWTATLPSRGSIENMTIDGLYPDNSVGGTIRIFGEHSGTNITASNCTQSAAGAIVTATAHGLLPHDVIHFGTVTGMTELSGRVLVVGEVPSADTFEIQDIDTSGYTAWSSTATFEKVSHYRVKNITVRNARFAQDDTPANQSFIQCLLDNQGLTGCIIDNLTIDGLVADNLLGQVLAFSANNVGAMFIDNITFKSMVVNIPESGTVPPTGSSVIFGTKSAGVTYGQLVNNLNLFNCKIRGYDKTGNERCIYITGAGQIKRMKFTDCHFSNLHSTVHSNGGGLLSDGYELYWNNCSFNNGYQAASISAVPSKHFINNVSAIDMGFGFVRTNTAPNVYTIYGDNLDWGLVDPMDSLGGTGVIRAVGLGIRTVAANLTPQSGDYVWDVTDSRPEVYNGAAWVAM